MPLQKMHMSTHETLKVQQIRHLLPRVLSAIAQGEIRLGFLGGSITDLRPGNNWPETVCAWFTEAYPDLRVVVENAAIGATGSQHAVFLARRNIIERGCDLVFVEYAVNDDSEPPELRRRWREGLIRQLLAEGNCDILFTYTFCQSMYEDMIAGRVPVSIADLEELAAHYRISSSWMALAAFREVLTGRMTWETWLHDGLHPHHRGSLTYGQAVIEHLRQTLDYEPRAMPRRDALPTPLDPSNWQAAVILPWSEVAWQGPWQLRFDPQAGWLEHILVTSSPGANLRFTFTGRACVACCDFGTFSGEFCWRIDSGAWQVSKRDRPSWVGTSGWLRNQVLAEDLAPGLHNVELRTLHGGDSCKGTNMRLAFIGVVR